MAEFNDETLQPRYDHWLSVAFHDRAENHTNLTEAWKNKRFAASVETETKVNLPCESPDELLLQQEQPAQNPRIDLGKTSKALSAKSLTAKLCSCRPVTCGDCS